MRSVHPTGRAGDETGSRHGPSMINVVCAAVLSRNYMLDVMYEFAVVLVNPTILATLPARSRTNRRAPASIIRERSGRDAGEP
jgi:hypothetical protein